MASRRQAAASDHGLAGAGGAVGESVEVTPVARFASRGGAAADPFGAPPAADTEVIQRRGNIIAPAPVPAAAPMDRKGR